MSEMFIKTILYTDERGLAQFKTEELPLFEGKPEARLSSLQPSSGYQLRKSPVGFKSQFHCTGAPQWVFILSGEMHIGLQFGEGKTFKAGEHFFSADTLPEGAVFDPKIHGHWSCQVGPEPLVTLFLREP
jgi:oxalate decarboxylase/phosphoglucose isomerase-like protein (cupin superfamily)